MRSAAVRIDGRTSVGGRIIHGIQRISPVAENANANAKLTVDGFAANGWTVGNPQFDSRKEEDGWHGFELNEGVKKAEPNLLILNDDDVVIHGGALTADETWAAGKVHIVRNWVRIPEGRTLTVAMNAVVKFCENTGIQVDGTIKANKAVFTSIADDTAGGDTDMNGETADVGYGMYDITGSGTKTLTDCDIRCAASLPVDTTWAAGRVIHVMGILTVPSGVTLTIQSGAVVKFATGAELKADGGSISANGAMFTHLADDSAEAGGDTNGDGDATSPVYDAYKLTGFSPSADCELRYITLTFAGGTISSTKILQGNRVHKVTGNITIASGGRLIVQPGAVVKMEAGLSINVNGGGTLEALGNRAQPIVFTSIKDDAHGGDTNGDGNKTEPQPGDWGRIEAGGTVNMNYVTISYLNNTGDRGAIQGSGGTVTFDNGIIEYSVYECVRMNSGSFTANNSIFREASMGFGYYGGSGTRCINCIITDVTVGCRASNKFFTNCVFYRVNSITDQGGDNSSFKNCVFFNPPGYGVQSYSKCGSNGNVWADPLFNNPDNGDYTLKEGSPCIDAGDGSVAPETDYFGQPRQDIREIMNTGTEAANGAVPDIGIHEMLPRNAAADVDFVAVSIHGAAAARVGDKLDVEWTIRNDGGEAAVGSWRDYVYLVDGNDNETLLGSFATTGSVAPNGLRVIKTSFTVADVNEGEYHFKLKCNMNRDIFEGTLTANNVVVSEGTVMISYPKAAVKDGISGSLPAGESIVKLMEVEEGYSLALIQAPKGTKVYYSLGTIPTADEHISSVACLDGTTMLSLPTGDVYLLIVAPDGEACDYRIDFTEDRLQISRMEPSNVMRNAVSHVLVHGSMFSNKAKVQLLRNGEAVVLQGEVLDDDDILVTVNASELEAGDYGVKVVDYDGEATLENAFHVTDGEPVYNVRYELKMPEAARSGRWFTVTLEYENTGNVEMPAPIFHLKSKGRNFDVNGTVHENEVWLYGIGTEYPYAWLKPGHVCKATFNMQMMANAEASVSISCASMASNDVNEALDLRGFFNEEWLLGQDEADASILTRLRTAVGEAKGDYRRKLADFYDAAGYGHTEAVDFSTMKKDFFLYSLALVTEQGAEEVEKTRGWKDDLYTENDELEDDRAVDENPNCTTPGRLLFFANRKALRKRDQWGEEYGKEVKFHDFLNDSSLVGNIWYFHKDCKWWHRAEKESVQCRADTPVYVICHGNECSIHEYWIRDLANKIVRNKSNAIVIAVDWGDAAMLIPMGLLPAKTAPYIPVAANAAFDNLSELGLFYENVTLIGHSHGSYLAGILARKMTEKGAKPKRLVALDASPMWTHKHWFADEATYPDAWNGEVAETVEFYKTSWSFSMAENDTTEVFGSPSFYVVGCMPRLSPERKLGVLTDENGRDFYYRDLNNGLVPKLGALDGGGIALIRHSYSHRWFRSTVGANSLGWNWNNGQWDKLSSSAKSLNQLKNSFHGVINGNGTNARLELGKSCFDSVKNLPNKYHREGKKENVGEDWRYDSLFFSSEYDDALGIGDYKALERFWNLSALVVEYMAEDLSIETDERNSVAANAKPMATLTVRNLADNTSINMARKYVLDPPLEEGDIKREKAYLNRFPEQMPWEYWVGLVKRHSITNNIMIYDLSTSNLDLFAKKKLLEKINGGITSIHALHADICNSGAKGYNLLSWTGDNPKTTAYIPAGGTWTKSAKLDFKDIAKRGYALGMKPDGCEYEDGEFEMNRSGEPFIVFGKVAQISSPGILGSYDYEAELYPGDLYEYDNYIAKVIYITPADGRVEAICREMIASSGTRGGDLHGEEGETQDNYPTVYYATADAAGHWSITLTGDKTWTTNDSSWTENMGSLLFYNWILPENAMASGEIRKAQKNIADPIAVIAGTLPEKVDGRAYQVTLSVFDFMSVGDNITVTVIASRPRQCMCMDGGLCICEACKCGKRGASGPNSPQSCDPNEMAGMSGFGDSATQRFVQPGEEMTYTIYFENKAEAEAAAQEVRVTQQLSNWLDWSTFQIVEVGFNNQIDTGLAGKSDGMSEISLDGTSWKVHSEVELNQKKGVVNCYLRIVDESTEDGWPEDPYAGFLPPNDDNHSGEGYIRYKIRVREDAPIGVRIDAEATIVFDYNDPITTSPAWFNWIGAENGVQPETGYLTWDLVDGATYQVTIWTGEADAEERNVVASSGALTENRWRLPTSLQNDTVYFWQVKTTAADGTVTESPVWGFDLGGRCTLELKPGWNLFSLPFKPESYTERILLGQNLFGIENNSYTRTRSLEGGKAYWLFQRDNGKRYLDIFPSQTRTDVEIPLKAGWNMVGPTDTDRHLDSGYTIWYWQDGRFAYLEEAASGGYTLKAGVGYWVYMP